MTEYGKSHFLSANIGNQFGQERMRGFVACYYDDFRDLYFPPGRWYGRISSFR